ncbi:nucleotidyltransferase family protein [Prevotella sp. 10(H)]|uniref:nucleotidyltransferase domain-containing protein n=1 Tax=Prevotella sp. 10(H) TaxID=1158294 RepID=UPI0004A6E64F|nr:nucleotidyltransferase family protein [Prevotella sp. 10(H)]
MTNVTDMFFTLLRLSLNIDKNSTGHNSSSFVDAKDEDWEQLFNLSVRQGVLLLSYGGLQFLPTESQPPRKLKLRWCVNVVKGSERYDNYKRVLAKLSNLFLDNNINLLVIKGITIAELYPVPYFRESGDIDIYLQDKTRQANDLMLSMGIKKAAEIPKHSSFILEGISIENHFTLFDTALQFRKESQLYKRMEDILNVMCTENICFPIHCGNIFQLSPQAASLYLIGHTFRHFCCLDINIRQMCDWTIFFSRNKNDIDSQLLSSQIKELGLEKFVRHINSFCASRFGFDPYFISPEKTDKKAEQFVLNTIMRYRLTPKIHIPVFGVLRYLIRRNNIYRKYLDKVNIWEFLLPEVKSYFTYLLKYRWYPASKKQD